MVMQGLEKPPAQVVNPLGKSDILLVCEHASNYIPQDFNNLGLTHEEVQSHIGWDIGAEATARLLSEKLDACLIAQSYSRLLYDCNRPPTELSAIPRLSEVTEIPGNKDLTQQQRDYRVEQIYLPFHEEIAEQIKARAAAGRRTILVTVHSFTPVFKEVIRPVQLGVICELDNSFAKNVCQQAQQLSDFDVRLNEPYGPSDPVLHMVTKHGTDNQLDNVMLEVRNDLIVDSAGQEVWAQLIADTLNKVHH